MKYKKLIAVMIVSLASINLFGCGDRMVEGINEAIEAEGGMEGVKNNAEELAGHFTDSLGITDAERFVIDEETGAIITDGNQTKEEAATNTDNYIGLNETVAFNMQNGGMINVTFTECGSKNDIAYITYVIENIGNIDVTVGESMFSVYANDYIADLNYGEQAVYEETISSGRKVSGKLYPNIIMDKVVKLEIECGDIVFLLRDTGKADAMLGTYYQVFEEDGNAVVNEVKLYRDVYNDDGLAIKAKQHIDYGNGYDYDYDFGSWTFDLYEDKIVFTNSLHSIGGLVVYYNSNPVVEGIYVEQVDTQSVEDMFTGQYLWTDDIQSVYDSVKNGNWLGANELAEENKSAIIEGSNYWWQEGANEDARGADVTIGYNSNGELRIVGKSWTSIESAEIDLAITKVNEDGSMEVESYEGLNDGILYIYPTENGGIRIEQLGMFGGLNYVTFDGTYQLRE